MFCIVKEFLGGGTAALSALRRKSDFVILGVGSYEMRSLFFSLYIIFKLKTKTYLSIAKT